MAPQPQRRTEAQRKTHLDASVVPVERALLHRSAELRDRHDARAAQGSTVSLMLQAMADEYAALAEELHYW